MGRGTAEDGDGTDEVNGELIPAAAVAWIAAGYRALGLDLDADARAVGLAPGPAPDAPEALVPRAAYAGLLARALARDPAFAVRAGDRVPFGTFALLDCTTAACATLRGAIDALGRYVALVTRNGRWRLDGHVLELVPAPGLPDWLRVASFELGLHYTAARFDELVGGAAVRSLEVPWPAPPWASAYPRPTAFEAPRAALVLDPDRLDAPSRRADPLVATLLARNADAVLAAWPAPAQATVGAAVRAALVPLLPGGLPTMAAVARALGQSPRTLRRRLAAEHLTFERVRDDTLAAIARARLRDPTLTVAEVAYLLGFSEARAFHRAFRRWTGMTPGQWRAAEG